MDMSGTGGIVVKRIRVHCESIHNLLSTLPGSPGPWTFARTTAS